MSHVIIDPGKNGAALVAEGCIPLDAYLLKPLRYGIDVADLREKLSEWQGLYGWRDIYVEVPPPRPHQGVHQTAVQFFIIGQIDSSLYGIGETLYEINPSTWTAFTKRLSSTPGAKAKVQAQELCRRYYPEFIQEWIPKTKIHDGVADCLAMLLYVNRDTYVDDIRE